MSDVGLTLVRTRNFADQVADALIEDIATSRLEPGQRIVENDLARQLRVSRVPVREAIKMLTAQGILEASPYRGTRIVPLDAIMQTRVHEVRAALEKLAARGARRTYAANPRALVRLDAILERMERAARDNDELSVNRADIEFHREICRASGNEIVMTLWEALARHSFVILAHEPFGPKGLQGEVEMHTALREAIVSGVEPLDERIDAHIVGRAKPPVRKWSCRASKFCGLTQTPSIVLI